MDKIYENDLELTHSFGDELPKMCVLTKIVDECKDFKTFYFDYERDCNPGQFLMIWLPQIDEKPLTLSFKDGKITAITVQRRGDFTSKLFDLQVGDKIGVRGPFGKGYRIDKNKSSCVICGGSGAAAVVPLVRQLNNPHVIIGARSNENLLHKKALPNAIFATDDGSFGVHGTVVDVFNDILQKDQIDVCFLCGPEKMMQAVIKICQDNNIECQFAMERYMKCGIGVCGNCTCGSQRVCIDGPVFDLNQLERLHEFGKIHRTRSGKEIEM